MKPAAALLIPAAVLCIAAAPAKKGAKAAKPPAAATAAGFDSQNPQGWAEVLTAAGAKAAVGHGEGDSVLLAVTSTAANFSVQFAGCDEHGRHCRAALFDSLGEGLPTLAQVNGFNQTSVNCRIYADKAGKAHVLYSVLLMPSDGREAARTHLAAWQGCLVDGRDFLRDPVAYLANAA